MFEHNGSHVIVQVVYGHVEGGGVMGVLHGHISTLVQQERHCVTVTTGTGVVQRCVLATRTLTQDRIKNMERKLQYGYMLNWITIQF